MTAVTPAVGADAEQLAQAELEPEREHQQDHAELGERLDDVRVGDERDADVRADDQPGEDVAEHDRLTEALGDQAGRASRAEHDRERSQEVVICAHPAASRQE